MSVSQVSAHQPNTAEPVVKTIKIKTRMQPLKSDASTPIPGPTSPVSGKAQTAAKVLSLTPISFSPIPAPVQSMVRQLQLKHPESDLPSQPDDSAIPLPSDEQLATRLNRCFPPTPLPTSKQHALAVIEMQQKEVHQKLKAKKAPRTRVKKEKEGADSGALQPHIKQYGRAVFKQIALPALAEFTTVMVIATIMQNGFSLYPNSRLSWDRHLGDSARIVGTNALVRSCRQLIALENEPNSVQQRIRHIVTILLTKTAPFVVAYHIGRNLQDTARFFIDSKIEESLFAEGMFENPSEGLTRLGRCFGVELSRILNNIGCGLSSTPLIMGLMGTAHKLQRVVPHFTPYLNACALMVTLHSIGDRLPYRTNCLAS